MNMGMFLTLAFLFCIGSIVGWGIEVLYRRFLSPANPDRHWINPGFCTGPWVPLYGSGLCILYLLSFFGDRSLTGDIVWDRILFFLVMTLSLTAVEYIAGILCMKLGKVRLWDYSRSWGNIQGIICPVFSLVWGIVGVLYFLFVHPYIQDALAWLSRNLAFSFVIGMFYGVLIIDIAHSMRLVSRIKAFAEEHQIIVRFEDVKMHIHEARERAGKKASFLFAFRSDISLLEHLKEAREAWEARH